MLPQQQRSVMRAVRAISQAVGTERHAVKALNATLWHWQALAFPELSRPERCPAYGRKEPVIALARLLAQSPFDEATFWLSSAYAQWVGDERRSASAMFFTPPALADRLIEDLIKRGANLSLHGWHDPACGGAAFLAPVARRMADALHLEGKSCRDILEHIESHLSGNDVDPALAGLTRHFLRMALYREVVQSGHEPAWRVTVGNALELARTPNADVVICNPPYRKMAPAEVAQYRQAFSEVMHGQPNLYGLFFQVCLDLVAPGGLAGLVTPTSFLSGQYFERLRTYLLGNALLRQMTLVAPRLGIFVGVEQEIAITVLERADRAPAATQTSVSVYSSEKSFLDLGNCVVPNSGAAWPIPRSDSDAKYIRLGARSSFRLADYGYQPRVGWYVDYRDKHTYKPRMKAGSNRYKKYVPLLWSSDISSDGGLAFNRLQASRHKGFIELPKWHATGIQRRPGVALQRVTSPDQPKRLVGAPLPRELCEHGIVLENHVLVLEQVTDEVAIDETELVELLKATAVDRYFRCISGAINVSIFELMQLPLPDPTRLRALLDSGIPMEEAAESAFGAQDDTGGEKR